jgi:hypothetical protein
MLVETEVSWVFSLSSGAMIALEAARTLLRITRAAVCEPPFHADGAPPTSASGGLTPRLRQAISRPP